MKIVYLTEYTRIGGGESNLISLVLQASLENDVIVVCPAGCLAERLRKEGITVTVLDRIGRKSWINFVPLLSFFPELHAVLSTADVIHCYSINTLPKVWVYRSKVAITIHGWWEKPGSLRGRVIGLLSQKVIAVSDDVFRICSTPAYKTSRVYLGKKFTGARRRSPIAGRIICIARFQKIKGQDLLIKAMKIVASRIGDCKFEMLFVGGVNSERVEDQAFYVSCRELARSSCSDNITFRFEGFQTDVESYYQQADLVVVPSRYESFSMVTIEALYFGLPVVVPAIGGVQEIINSDEIGLRFMPDDPCSLADAICSCVNGKNQFDQNECKKRALEFSVACQLEKLISIYNEIKKSDGG